MKHQISPKSVFATHAKLFIIFLSLFLYFFLSFSVSLEDRKPRGLMNDVGKLLRALMSYKVFVLVHFYLRLPENVLPCKFHKHWGSLYIARCHFIVVRKTPYFICYTVAAQSMVMLCSFSDSG